MKVKAIVEMPKLTRYKYEKSGSKLKLDRVLRINIPHNYGYVPGTICEDGDPLDIFIISDSPIHPLTRVEAELVAVLYCEDNGVRDDKLIASISSDNANDLPGEIGRIRDYLLTYKKGFDILEHGDAEQAKMCYNHHRKAYAKS